MPALKAKQQQKQTHQQQYELSLKQLQQTKQLLLLEEQKYAQTKQNQEVKNWFLPSKATTITALVTTKPKTTIITAMISSGKKMSINGGSITSNSGSGSSCVRVSGVRRCCRSKRSSSLLTIALLLLVSVFAVVSAAGSNGNGGGASVRTGATNSRLPRTSASQLNSGSNGGLGGGGVGGGGSSNSFKLAAKTLNNTRNGNLRT
ncbi:PREDICTED: uncharacterized protein LOC108365346, partial [Rhagoletis zephyria]|uniref:uncharacterized protein LOC108365346 n=1 Tax=Rhagoletis zephyria TaxID=28612 RepID=UPI000811A80D